MTETRTITFRVFRNPSGEPTCCADALTGAHCKFLGAKEFGLVPVCMAVGEDLHRASDAGWLVPNGDCPLWAGRP